MGGLVGVAALSTESFCPHSAQNLVLARTAAPQDGQLIDSAAPHSPQNLLLSGTTE
jgi:hypothetical protein